MVSQKEELQVEGMEDQKIRCVGWVETEAEMRRRKRQEEKQENEGEEGKALKWSFNHTVIYSHPAGGKEDCSRAEQSRAEQSSGAGFIPGERVLLVFSGSFYIPGTPALGSGSWVTSTA